LRGSVLFQACLIPKAS